MLLIGVFQRVSNVLSAVEPQGVFDTVHVQPSALTPNGEVVSVRGKAHLRCLSIWSAEERQLNFVRNGKALPALLRLTAGGYTGKK